MTPTRRGFLAALAAITALPIASGAYDELPAMGGDSLADAADAALRATPPPGKTGLEGTLGCAFRRQALRVFAMELSAAVQHQTSFVDRYDHTRYDRDGWRQLHRNCDSSTLTLDLAREMAREMAAEVMAEGVTQFADLSLPAGVFQVEHIHNAHVGARMVVDYDIRQDALTVRFDVLVRKS